MRSSRAAAVSLALGIAVVVFASTALSSARAQQASPIADEPQAIVFVRHSSFHAMTPTGRNVRRLNRLEAALPRKFERFHRHAWSPDRSKFAVMGSTDLYVMDADGTDRRRLQIAAANFAWSPDSAALVVVDAAGDAETPWLVVFGSDGQRLRRLTRGLNPQWASDGRVYFDRQATPYVFSVRADGSDERRVIEQEFPWEVSPDSTKIALYGGSSDGVDVANIDGTDRRKVTPLGAKTLAWSPRGDQLAFLMNDERYGGTVLWLIRVDGSGRRRVAQECLQCDWPDFAWSPDGAQLAYDDVNGRYWDIWLINANGSGRKQLTKGSRRTGHSVSPVWAPAAEVRRMAAPAR